MNFIITPLRWIIDLLYSWVGSYSIAIILFTLVVKLILLPLLIVLAYSVFQLPAIISLTIAVAMAAPSGAMCTMFAVRYDRDAHYASEIFAATTILSMATLPLIVWVAGFLL